ncbi:hypothetical protein [Beijerinckia indica]|uniref:hypothetical protein n=1 Tax=Beijerinckia indica TaxID=533 RepID=UPI0002F43578|nr:hypothetical protein [Beijerinckia indica]
MAAGVGKIFSTTARLGYGGDFAELGSISMIMTMFTPIAEEVLRTHEQQQGA